MADGQRKKFDPGAPQQDVNPPLPPPAGVQPRQVPADVEPPPTMGAPASPPAADDGGAAPSAQTASERGLPRVEAAGPNMPYDLPENTNTLDTGPITADGSRVYTFTGTRDRLDPGNPVDLLHISDRRRREWGIPADAEVIAVRNPREYQRVEVDRVDQMLDKYETFRLLDVGGAYKRQGDLLFALVNKDELQHYQKGHDRQGIRFAQQFAEGEVHDGEEGVIREFRQDQASLSTTKAHTREMLRGILDRWPRGMKYQDVLRYMGAEATLDIERRFARGGRQEQPGEYEDYEQRLQEQADKAARRSRRSYSFPGQSTQQRGRSA